MNNKKVQRQKGSVERLIKSLEMNKYDITNKSNGIRRNIDTTLSALSRTLKKK